MDAKINHLTIISEDNYALGRFYEAFFHMRPRPANGATEPVRLGDGTVGMNINPRLSGHPAQLDHFGIEVGDIEAACARIRENYPQIEFLDGAGAGPFASLSTHDPDGNVFRLSQTGARDHDEIYEAEGGTRDRVVDHFALRVAHPERVAEFYVTVFELSPLDRPSAKDNFYLSDGHVTLVIIPWRLRDFEGTGITARGMDHIGFRVDSIASLKADMDAATERNYRFRPSNTVVGRGKEGAQRLVMFKNACPLGSYHMADSDGLLIDITE